MYYLTTQAGTSSFTDTFSLSIGSPIATVGWLPPPSNLAGLQLHPAGFMYGFSGNILCLSELDAVYAFPLQYQMTADTSIVACGMIGMNGIFVSSKNSLYTTFGADPAAMTPLTRVPVNGDQICQSKRSMAVAENMLMYAGVDGICGVDQTGNVSVLTSAIFNRSDWQAYNPSSIAAWYWNGFYIGSYNNGTAGGFIYDMRNQQFELMTMAPQAGYHDRKNGALFLLMNNSGTQTIVKFDGGSTPLAFDWRSRIVRFDQPAGFGAAIVSCQNGPFTMTTYADGLVKDTITVTNSMPFRLTDGKAYEWEVEITGMGRVEAIHMATSMRELADVNG